MPMRFLAQLVATEIDMDPWPSMRIPLVIARPCEADPPDLWGKVNVD